jgi:DNA-directed RNA polymerase subunit M/transcription elongation factor TFIIS
MDSKQDSFAEMNVSQEDIDYSCMYFESLSKEDRKKIFLRSGITEDFEDVPSMLRSLAIGNKVTERVSESSVYRCSRCTGRRIEIIQKQVRSTDEGVTLFFSCECGYSWSQN